MEPPYRLLETSADTTVEIELPFWIDHADVRVKITAADVEVEVRNELRLKRTFWRNEEEAAKGADYPGPVDAAQSEWSLIDSVDGAGNSCKVPRLLLKMPLTKLRMIGKGGFEAVRCC